MGCVETLELSPFTNLDKADAQVKIYNVAKRECSGVRHAHRQHAAIPQHPLHLLLALQHHDARAHQQLRHDSRN